MTLDRTIPRLDSPQDSITEALGAHGGSDETIEIDDRDERAGME